MITVVNNPQSQCFPQFKVCSIFNQFEDTVELRYKSKDIVNIAELNSEELANVKNQIIPKEYIYSFCKTIFFIITIFNF